MVALTALLFWMLATGRVYTKTQHDSIVDLHKERFKAVKEVLDITMSQNTTLIESGGAAQEFFEKVPVELKPEHKSESKGAKKVKAGETRTGEET